MKLMEPLHWPDSFKARVEKLKDTDLSGQVAQVVWFFQFPFLYSPVKRYISEQLILRERPNGDIWGDNERKVQLAELVCKLIKQEYRWPNDHFIPDDPFEIIYMMPWDASNSDILDFLMAVEKHLKVKIKRVWEKGEPFTGETLEDFVDFILQQTS